MIPMGSDPIGTVLVKKGHSGFRMLLFAYICGIFIKDTIICL